MHVAIGMAQALGPDQARLRTTCRLFKIRQDPINSSSEVIERGSGFHYGGGWIVTTSRIAGVNAANVPSLWVQLYEPVSETPGQVWRTFPPRRRFCVYLHIAGQADVRDYDIVAFQVHVGEGNNIIQGLNDVPGAVPFEAELPPPMFDTYCIHYGAGAAMPDEPQVTEARYSIVPGFIFSLRNSPWPSLQNSQWPLFYQTPAAVGNGSSGAPVFDTNDQFIGVHLGRGFIVSFVVVRLFMMKILSLIANVKRRNEYKSMLQNPKLGSLRHDTNRRCEECETRIQDNLRAMPWPMSCYDKDECC